MFIENLEGRRLMSSTVTASLGGDGTVHVSGTADGDQISVDELTGAGVVQVTAIDPVTQNTETIGSFAIDSVTRVQIDAKGLDDSVSFSGFTIGADIYGGDGNDVITVNDAGTASSFVDGGNGADHINVNVGNNTVVHGRNGDDVITVASGSATVYGDNGDDIIILGNGTSGSVSGGNGTDSVVVLGSTSVTIKAESTTYVQV